MVLPLCDTTCGAAPPAPPAPVVLVFVAGEVAFDGSLAPEPFSFTQVGSASSPVPVGVLDPASNLFDSPSPGVLRYIGDSPLRVRASYSITFLWDTGPSVQTAFFSILIVNGENVGETIQGLALSTSAGFTVFSESSDALLVLQPGDELQVGVAGIVPGTYTISSFCLTLVANRI